MSIKAYMPVCINNDNKINNRLYFNLGPSFSFFLQDFGPNLGFLYHLLLPIFSILILLVEEF
ncbi:hypothetical protein ABN235_19225, partial [Morganella morganii]|uniref:hypothetical protein n=1 Tax=Morganella morganii TaxID=582 RepID=UPI0032DA0411